MPFPLVKLGYLLIKQASKPLSRVIRNKAKTSSALRKIVLPPAQFYHRWDTTFRMRLLGLKTTEVRPMSDEMAIELASDIIGEMVILGVGVFVIWLEYARQQRKDDKKEDMQNERLVALENKVNLIGEQLDHQLVEIQQLRTFLQQFEVPDEIIDSRSGTVLKVKGKNHSIKK